MYLEKPKRLIIWNGGSTWKPIVVLVYKVIQLEEMESFIIDGFYQS